MPTKDSERESVRQQSTTQTVRRPGRKPNGSGGPPLFEPLPAAIAHLAGKRQWVLWNWRLKPGAKKPTKVPRCSRGGPGESDNPATWDTYAGVLSAYKRGGFDGIGIVLSGDIGIGAFDLDHCLKNGKPVEWAQQLIDAADSYVEVTPSGDGLRVIGTINSRVSVHCKQKFQDGTALEIWRRATRFMTVTGDQRGNCTKLKNIDALIDHYNKQSGAYVGEKTRTAIDQGVAVGKRSDSFHGVVCTLAEQFLDPDAILAEITNKPISKKYEGRLQTEVDRCWKKWAYAYIINHVAPQVKAANKSGPAKNIRDMQTTKFDPLKEIIPGYLCEGLTLLAAKPKVGKSYLMLQIALCVGGAEEMTVFGQKCLQGDVLYCALEDNERRMQKRINNLWDRPGVFGDLWPNVYVKYDMPKLKDGGVLWLRNWLRQVRNPTLVIVDTLQAVRSPRKTTEGVYEADYESMKELHALATEFKVAIVVVHHLRKDEGGEDASPFDLISGSLGLPAKVDHVIVIRETKECYKMYGASRDLDSFNLDLMRGDPTAKHRGRFEWHIHFSPKEKDALAFLSGALSGGPRDSAVIKNMAEAQGIGEKALRKAREKLGVLYVVKGFPRRTEWCLPS
jgi:RecA-family ATPase